MTASLARLREAVARKRALPVDDFPSRDARDAARDRRTIAILTRENAALTREVARLTAGSGVGHEVRVPEQRTETGA